jgi:cytochrome c553
MSGRISFVATCLLVAGAALLEYCRGAAAQPAPNPADELRPLYANAADVAEGKRLADASCSGCHGQNGISTSPGVPSLAGQRPAYLYIELKAYQTGARGAGPMTDTVKFLSNNALIAAAAYFASLEPDQPSAAGGTGAPAVDPVQAGKTAAAACAGCHGETGISRTPGIPSLVALDQQYLVAAMKAYQSGQRKNDTMKAMLASTSEASLNAIALYYALQMPARAPTPAAGDAGAGAAAAAGCAGCHGDKGSSGNPAIPGLAGQDAEYLGAALGTYPGHAAMTR